MKIYQIALILALFAGGVGGIKNISPGHRLPDSVMPVLGCWFWHEGEFMPEGYKSFIDTVSLHSPFNMLTTSIRAPGRQVTDTDVHDQIKAAARYARLKGLQLVMDLDVRLARQAFAVKYPEELQEMLMLKEVELLADEQVDVVVHSLDLSDHYTHRTTHYIPLYGTIKRVYTYNRDKQGILPGSLRESSALGKIISISGDSVKVRLPSGKKAGKSFACVLISFTHLTPDVFAPHLIDFQRDIIAGYQDVPLAGVCKDEWGFPPCFDGNPDKDQFWYSASRARHYADRTGGRDLLEDCLLMHFGFKGKEEERLLAINHFMEMSWQRNADLEDDFYHTVKRVFGSESVVATHPTWWPYPDMREFKKNGLDWWIATRDWAQTDEVTPFAVRSALSKKWGSPVWYNMYYSKNIEDYERSIWRFVLAGGRINYHPIYPSNDPDHAVDALLHGNLMKAESRIRLLNFISRGPLDCPVAVIFGHHCATNWAGPAYNDVGMNLADEFWRNGFPADLIPSSEIEANNLTIDDDGWICYGIQRYAIVILYHPEFEKTCTVDFFRSAAGGSTALFRVGDWTRDFQGRVFQGNRELPPAMICETDTALLMKKIFTILDSQGIQRQSLATDSLKGFNHFSIAPPPTGFCHLVDGTVIQIAGTHQVSGDPIQTQIQIEGREVIFDALGLAAVNIEADGQLQSLAAGGLKYFSGGDLEIELDKRIDLALWKDKEGKWQGVVQDWNEEIPSSLLTLTQEWGYLASPPPLSPKESACYHPE